MPLSDDDYQALVIDFVKSYNDRFETLFPFSISDDEKFDLVFGSGTPTFSILMFCFEKLFCIGRSKFSLNKFQEIFDNCIKSGKIQTFRIDNDCLHFADDKSFVKFLNAVIRDNASFIKESERKSWYAAERDKRKELSSLCRKEIKRIKG